MNGMERMIEIKSVSHIFHTWEGARAYTCNTSVHAADVEKNTTVFATYIPR